MVATGEILIVGIVIVAGAVAVPIMLDVDGPGIIPNSLCVIISGPLNFTCSEPGGNVTFIGQFPITITPNTTTNSVTWSLVSGNASHTNIGGGAEVFKNETGGIANLRTLVGSGGVSVIQNNETITIQTGGGPPGFLSNINNGSGPVFTSATEGDTATFVGKGIKITNSSSVTFELNATAGELLDVNYTSPPDERDILIWNVTTQSFENKRIDNLVSLIDVFFNAEEATVDDLTQTDCVNDITYSFFDNTDPNEYRRQAVEFCPDSDPDDNISWLYVVPKDFSQTSNADFKFRLFWSDDDSSVSSYMQVTTNDCEQQKLGSTVTTAGRVTCTSSDIELHDEGTETPKDWNDYSAYRYTNVPIPNGATIVNATIQYHVDETEPNVPLTVRFRGHDHDNSPVLTTTNFDISSRTETTAFVDWAVPHWASVSDEGPAQLSPNLATIVQEIVDRPGWVSGNAMTVMIKDWPVTGGFRTAESAEGEPSNAPTITIFWSTGGGASPVCFEFSLLARQNTELLDDSFTARKTECVNRSGLDQLSVTEFLITDAEHNFSPEDLVFFRIHRPNDFVANDFESDVYVLGGELQWLPD